MHPFKSPLIAFAIAGCIAGALAGTALRQYEGGVQFRPGQVANDRDIDIIRPILTPDVVVMRLKQPSFYDQALRAVCDMKQPSTSYDVTARVLITSGRFGPPITITVKSRDPAIIRPCAEAIYRKFEAEQLTRINATEAAVTAALRRLQAGQRQTVTQLPGSVVLYAAETERDREVAEAIAAIQVYLPKRADIVPALISYTPPSGLSPAWWCWPLVGVVAGLVVGWWSLLAFRWR